MCRASRVLAKRGDRWGLASYLARHFCTPDQANFAGSNLIDAGLIAMARQVVDYSR